ncbi:MAG: hypothetical protein Kow0089_12550 [Desulfobulbaceae bacterium]
MRESPSRIPALAAFLFLFLAGTVTYWNSLDVPFYLDDFRNIVENSHVHIRNVTLASLSEAAFESPLRKRPVANISFALDYLLHGGSLRGFHLVNLALHLGNGFLLFLVFRFTVRASTQDGKESGMLVPFLATLLWLVHPLHTGSVTYIVQRMLLLSVFFYLLSFYCYLRGRTSVSGPRTWTWFACALTAGLLAMGSKENAVTLPVVLFLYEWFFFQDLDQGWLRRRAWIVGGMAVGGFLLFVFYVGSIEKILEGYANRPFTLGERLLTEWRIILIYLGLLAFPHPSRLNMDHHVSVSRSLIDPPSTIVSLLVILLMVCFAATAAKRQRIVSFAILWYLVNLILESTILPLELIFEHRAYLPSIFLFPAIVLLLFRFVRPPVVAAGLVLAVSVLCGFWTIQRNEVWRDPVRFWSESAAKSPQKARPFMNLSVALREAGRIDEAIRASQRAIALDPGFVNAWVGLGAAYEAKGDFAAAEQQYRRALEMMPGYTKVYNGLGVLYARQGRMREALASFNRALALDPDDRNALVNRASILAQLGNPGAAIRDFRQALESGGPRPDILFNLAVAYTALGEIQAAVHAYEELLRLDPADQEARANLEALRSRLPGRKMP